MKESKHAARLRELGFVLVPEAWREQARQEKEQFLKSLSRKNRRAVLKLRARGGFHRNPNGYTYLTDELDIDWMAPKHIDLFKELGFPDLLEEIGLVFGEIPKSRLN